MSTPAEEQKQAEHPQETTVAHPSAGLSNGKTYKIVLIRHGESLWNLENRFTGWTDVSLTQKGREEASHAGKLLKQHGFKFNKAFTSLLKRAIHTLDIALDELGQSYLPVEKLWRLNERMYGGLTGLNKDECKVKYGDEQVLLWRRSVNVSPPDLDLSSEYHPANDERYKHVPKCLIPSTENLLDCIDRVLPAWFDNICPEIISGKQLIVSIHGNSIRALVKHLDGLSNEGRS